MTLFTYHNSPLGALLLTGDRQSLTGIYLPQQKYYPTLGPGWEEDPDAEPFEATRTQLDGYFAGDRHSFDLPLAPVGTEFQHQVWHLLRQIPYGETRSYGDLAQDLKLPGGARAVGAANGRNPLSIVVPCHRVIAASGALTGYAGGLDRKQWLLRHEQAFRSEGAIESQGQLQLSLMD
jgi:methylated-DNA-[protein]-cysteine S-methyltransferase